MKFDHNASSLHPEQQRIQSQTNAGTLTVVLPPASKSRQAAPILCSSRAEPGPPAAGRDLCSLFRRSVADQKDFLSTPLPARANIAAGTVLRTKPGVVFVRGRHRCPKPRECGKA